MSKHLFVCIIQLIQQIAVIDGADCSPASVYIAQFVHSVIISKAKYRLLWYDSDVIFHK